MLRRIILVLLAACLLPAAWGEGGVAQDADNPTIAILRFGPHLSYYHVDHGLFGGLMAAGFINQAEHDLLMLENDLAGERINVLRLDANFDFANATFIVEKALDAGADVLITYSTPVTQAASLITADMDAPPAVIFAEVFDPVSAGIVQSSCIKPDHVTGVEMSTPYEEIVPLLLAQDPNIQQIGILYSTAESSGLAGSRRIAAAAESLGLMIDQAGVAQAADLALAAEALVEGGAEALIIPADMMTVSAMPIIMQVATENQLPVFHSNGFAFNDGATVSAGPVEHTRQGGLIASMVLGRLAGSLDIARAGIAAFSDMKINLNLDSAAAQGIELSEALQEMASVVIKDGKQDNKVMRRVLGQLGLDAEAVELVMQAADRQVGGAGQQAPLPPHVQELVAKAMASAPRGVDVGAMMASLHCTDAMIAEQQAALESE